MSSNDVREMMRSMGGATGRYSKHSGRAITPSKRRDPATALDPFDPHAGTPRQFLRDADLDKKAAAEAKQRAEAERIAAAKYEAIWAHVDMDDITTWPSLAQILEKM